MSEWLRILRELKDARGFGNVQSVSLTLYLQRDCWRWFEADRYKGHATLYAGPFAIELEA